MKRTLTITIVFEVADAATAAAIEKAADDMLDEGTLQDWILDAAADNDDFDDDAESVSATSVMERA